jgi:histidine triad (HIT) family protein
VTCVFCQIAEHVAPASIIHEDADLLAFMTLHPTAPGECLIIPRVHVDHFTDVDDSVGQRIMQLALVIGRRMRVAFTPERAGMVVHGYGVAHAHLVLVAQQGPHHITSDRFATVQDGQVVFDLSRVPVADRSVLEEHARLLSRPLPSESLSNPRLLRAGPTALARVR